MHQAPVQHAPDRLALHGEPSKITGLNAAQLNAAVKAGMLPPPVRIGVRLRGWRVADLLRLVQAPTNPTA